MNANRFIYGSKMTLEAELKEYFFMFLELYNSKDALIL